jgi:hypothetical protein
MVFSFLHFRIGHFGLSVGFDLLFGVVIFGIQDAIGIVRTSDISENKK